MSIRRSANNFIFHGVKHVGFRAKESVFAGKFTALLYSKEIWNWSSQNSCWDIRWPCPVGNNEKRDWFGRFKNNNFDVEDKKISLTHRKNLKTENWKHDFMKTYVRRKLGLQKHYESITPQFWNVWKHLESFKSKDIGCVNDLNPRDVERRLVYV